MNYAHLLPITNSKKPTTSVKEGIFIGNGKTEPTTNMNIKTLVSLTELIQKRCTGTPSELAEKLGISERMVYKYIDDLKEEFNAPVKYSRSERTYFYDGEGHLHLFWEKEE